MYDCISIKILAIIDFPINQNVSKSDGWCSKTDTLNYNMTSKFIHILVLYLVTFCISLIFLIFRVEK